MDELRASALKVLKLGMYDMHVSVPQIKQYRAIEKLKHYIYELCAKRTANFEARNVQNCEIIVCTRCAVQNVQC